MGDMNCLETLLMAVSVVAWVVAAWQPAACPS